MNSTSEKRASLPYALSSSERLRVYSVATGMSAPLIGAESIEHLTVVIAKRARMKLHDQSVLDGHARHLHQHVRLETPLIRRRRLSSKGAQEDRRCILIRQARRVYGSTTAWSVAVAPSDLKHRSPLRERVR